MLHRMNSVLVSSSTAGVFGIESDSARQIRSQHFDWLRPKI